jgi:hypothetical protein
MHEKESRQIAIRDDGSSTYRLLVQDILHCGTGPLHGISLDSPHRMIGDAWGEKLKHLVVDEG